MRAFASIGLVMLAGCSLIVDPPEAVHPETLVNSIGGLDQSNPMAVFVGDHYLVVWQDSSVTPPDLSEDAIRGRFVDRTGAPEGSDFLVNDPARTLGAQEHPRVAVAGGTVLVAWTDQSGLGPDLDATIRARVVSAGGGFQSDDVQVSTTLAGIQEQVAVAAAADTFVVVWTDASGLAPDAAGLAIRGRRLRLDGTPLDTADFVINSTIAGDQREPAIAHGSDGRYLVVWTDAPAVGSSEIRGRLLGADGTRIGSDFVVNSTTQGEQLEPTVTATPSGYVVAWTDLGGSLDDPEGKAVRARRLDPSGQPLADDVLVNATKPGDQGHAFAATLPDGSFAIVYEDASLQAPDRDGNAVRLRRFAADGTPADEQLANTFFTGDQEDPSLAVDDAGALLVVWEDGSARDGSDDAIEARVYAP
ncbi:MAG TPA: hypothetical protein VFQ53_21740 [Kofleriaceae bacterium]|nr:hypothetical protein [Kofleriaceae bacterium]